MNEQLIPQPARQNQAAIDFHGASLMTAEFNETVYAAMKPIVEGIGLDWRSQRAKINASQRWGDIAIPFQTAGGTQEMLCLPITKLNGWLFSVNPAKVKESIREKVILYQEECFEVLYNYWHKGAAVKPEYHKRCAMCESVLPLSEFRQDKRYHGGYNPVCNSCRKPRPRLRIQPPKPTKEEVLEGILEHYVAIQRIIKEDDTLSIHDLTEEEQDQGIQYYARWLLGKE